MNIEKLGKILRRATYSTYELMYILWEKVEELIDGIVGKTDLYGDHKGTWQGYKPTQVDYAITSILDTNIENIGKNRTDIDKLYFPLLDKEIALFIKYGVSLTKSNIRYPYCHVDRYGGDTSGVNDSSDSIQIAVDVCEYMATLPSTPTYVIGFSGGTYLMLKTVLIKGDYNNCIDNSPISLVGVDMKILSASMKSHTTINIKIPNHGGKSYANAFAINVKYTDYTLRNDEVNSVVFSSYVESDGGFSVYQICDNISFKNLAFITDHNLYNINVIKGYRYRSDLENIYCGGALNLVCQPSGDTNNVVSCCDFSSYKRITFYKIQNIGLELYQCDNTVIEETTSHYLGINAMLFRIVNASGVRVNNIHHAYNFVEGTTTPRNDGSGLTGYGCLILLNGCESTKIHSMYIERCLKDYVFRIYNSKMTEISNTDERFFCNGYVSIEGTSEGVHLHDINRNCNLVDGYKDIYVRTTTQLRGLTVKGFVCRNFYSNVITLATVNFSFTSLSKLTPNYRITTHNIDPSRLHFYDFESVILTLTGGTGTVTIRRSDNNPLDNPSIFTATLSAGVITMSENAMNVTPAYQGGSGFIPFIPLLDTSNGGKIYFMDTVTGGLSAQESGRLKVYVEIKTANKHMY